MLSFRGTRNFKACSLKYYLLLINIEMLRVKHYIKAQHFFKNDTCFWIKTFRHFAPRKHSSLKFGICVISSKNQFLARHWSINKQVPFNSIERKLYFETKLSSSSMSYPALKNVTKNCHPNLLTNNSNASRRKTYLCVANNTINNVLTRKLECYYKK